VNNYYGILGVKREATTDEIKKAFREKAKRLHPDIAGSGAEEAMRKLLTAYEVLSSAERRYEYDRAYNRFVQDAGFDYRSWLHEQARNGEDRLGMTCRAKLVFFELLHLEEDEAINIWRKSGGIDFKMEKYLDREDWMDCLFILAEELDRRGFAYEAFHLLVTLIREERRLPYFKLFAPELEAYLKTLVRQRLRAAVNDETWIGCLEIMLSLGFPARDEARWMRSLAETLAALGDIAAAGQIMGEALKRGAAFPRKGKRRQAKGAI
jgi:hypothetical protein